ncbi:unnamed protein product [Prunus armeniaca]
MKPPRQAEGASTAEMTATDRRQEKRVAKAEAVLEAPLQVTEKRQIEGALDVTHLPKRQNEGATILIPDDEEKEDVGPMNVACPQKVVSFVNCFIDSAQMELSELV